MDFYNTTDMNYTELAITLEDFTYGTEVKITIPSLLPLVDLKNEPISNTYYLSNRNIVNKDKYKLHVGSCTKSNYITISVPKDLCPCLGVDPKCNHKGTKGQKFIVSFIGGNINKPILYRRVD